MIRLFFIVNILTICWPVVKTTREVTCSCGVGPDDSCNDDRVLSGPPGKRGAMGLPGSKDMIHAVYRKDCNDVANHGYTTNGIYMISIQGKFVEVYCDLESDGGSWLVFQRRNSGEVDFYLNWTDYKTGFGNKSKEFWLGLDNLHDITSSGSYKLRVDLEDWDGNTRYAEYSLITVGDASTNYRLNIGSHSGTAGDSLEYHNNRPFSTKDEDHDSAGAMSCAMDRRGAWWFGHCSHSSLNSKYFSGGHAEDYKGINWVSWKGYSYSMKKAEMKVCRI